jgi:transposase
MKKISKEKKRMIIKLKKAQVSISEIAKMLEISKSTVTNYTKNLKVKLKKNKGRRPKKLSCKMISNVVKDFSQNNCNFLTEGKDAIEKKFKIRVTKQTIRNYLKSNGFKCRIKGKKLFCLKRINKGASNLLKTF